MKNKVVVWGTNEQEEKVLIALELQAESNKVMLYTFPEAVAPDEFVNKMMNEWREGKPVEFPEGHSSLERELTVTEGLLPDGLKVERGDVITRAQTEWHFAVLSAKLHAAYQQELAEFQEKVRALGAYDAGMWDSLKGFWDKVQGQSRDRNIFRNHADQLRDGINALFEDLKKLRTKVNSEFQAASSGIYEEFTKALEDIEARIEAGGSKLNTVFDDLKNMQRRYRDARMSNEHRNKIWDRLDGAFKAAKERKFGPSANEGSVVDRHDRRLVGLQDALKRMQDSVRRDEEELAFQRKKVSNTEGQLEAQIRMAKIKMVEERVNSKRERLNEMQQTLNDVERQAGSAKEKENKRAEKDAERQRFVAAKEKAKSEIAASIRSRDAGRPAPAKEESLFEAAGTMLGDVLMDALDTMKAVASVAADKADEVLAEVVEKVEDMAEALTKKEEAPVAEAPAEAAAEPVAEAVAEAAAEPVAEAVAEAAEAAAEPVAEAAAEPVAEAVAEAAEAAAEPVAEAAAEPVAEAVAEAAEAAAEPVAEAAAEVAEAPAEVAEAPATEEKPKRKPAAKKEAAVDEEAA